MLWDIFYVTGFVFLVLVFSYKYGKIKIKFATHSTIMCLEQPLYIQFPRAGILKESRKKSAP